ncbi:MAG: translation initiation factor IF-3 [Parcubacteria group bacterium SW_6_46_9]|nr:MAG: translation initiation factor IF-3 [Parcubacteria group bacterium SW_6_46_9]
MANIDTNANTEITADEVRVIDPEGENIGVKPLADALEMARDHELDLVEVAPNAEPPVAKIMDFGKYKYEKQKSRQGSKSNQVETKTVQVKINTGEHDLQTKAEQASGWLEDGNRVRLELYLRGRAKGKSREFHRERMDRFLKFVTADYTITQEPEKGPKGLNMMLEPA